MFSMLTLQLPEHSVQAHYHEKLDHLAFAKYNALHFKLKALPWTANKLRDMDKCHSLAIRRGLHFISSHVILSPVCVATQN